MNSTAIQKYVYNWAIEKNFDAPYGVLTGSHTSNKGKKFLTVTFGRTRTLDATVEIYNRNFIILNTSRDYFGKVLHSFEELKKELELL